MPGETKTKHTPGPWTIDPNPVEEVVAGLMILDAGASTVAVVLEGDIDEEQLAADTQLIAAAPDLLAAAKNSLSRCRLDCTPESYCGGCGPLLAAIAKAEGKP